MNVRIEVKERPTGAFAFGFGYSSYNQLYGVASISQNNLFGRGQKLKLEASIGSRITQYELGFTEPWLFDIPLLAGASLYSQRQQYDTYVRDAKGLSLVAGYPLMDYVTLSGRYKFDNSTIEDVIDTAPDLIKAMEGTFHTRSVAMSLRRDTRDRIFNPTSGSDNSISVEYAGGVLGGDTAFNRYILDSGWFFPLPWLEHVFFLRGKLGYIVQRSEGALPVYERFYLGGMESVRGFAYGAVGPRDPETGAMLGGVKMALFNAEYIFPLFKESGLMGVLFYDAGNAWDRDETMSGMQQSVGGGIRFYSPLGPLRLEWGYILHPRPGEQRSRWEFSIGTFF
jgi:outer membrane protein insertion porin family